MTQTSLVPPPKRGGKTLPILAVLTVFVIVFFAFSDTFMIGDAEEPEYEPAPAASTTPPSTSLAQAVFVEELPSEPDAAAEEAPTPEEADAPPGRSRRANGGGGCEGTLSAAAARQVVNRNRGRVRSCYERRLKTNNSLQGQVSVNVRIGTSGQVSGVRVGGSLRDPEVFNCIRTAVSSWTFPAPEGGCANLSVPFSFSPRM